MKYATKRLIIWRSQVQALAGPLSKSSTYEHPVSAFPFLGDLQVTFLKRNFDSVTS